MKNLTTILTELGIEVPEEKKSELEKQLGENYKPVSEVEKVRAARDNYKAQLDTAQETLKSFEGVDVNELQGKISTLQNDLAAQKTAFEQQISDMEFNSMLEDAIGKAGARSVKAVKAELDIDAIKASKNQQADLNAAITACKEANGFLFGSNEPINNPIMGSSKGGSTGADANAAMRAAFGLPVSK